MRRGGGLPSIDVVIPTAGRDSLAALLDALARGRVRDALGGRVIVVDDRVRPECPLELGADVEVVRGPGRGPAAARNAGWHATRAEWVAFLDDDVVPERDYDRLEEWHKKRYLVLPGITGLWQVSGRSALDFDDLVRLDFLYLERWSIGLDLTILMKTVPAVLTRRGAF